MAKATKGLKKLLIVGLILLGGICAANTAGGEEAVATPNQEVKRVPYLEIGDTILFDLKLFDAWAFNETLILKKKGE